MDRKKQLGNVSFGGDWSEQITVREGIAAAMHQLEMAVSDCMERDPRTPEVDAALELIAARVARGALLADAWRRAASIAEPEWRSAALHRAWFNLSRVLGAEFDP